MKNGGRTHTKGNFVIKVKDSYFIENKLWTSKEILFTADIEKAKVFTYKEHAEDFSNATLKEHKTEIIELKSQ